MGSVLCGGGAHNSTQAIGSLPKTNVNLGPAVPPIEADVGSHGESIHTRCCLQKLICSIVVAAVLMGDPRFTKGMPFNKGTAQNSGV